MTLIALVRSIWQCVLIVRLAYYRIVQNLQGTKLLQLGHQVSICRKMFTFASKQRPQVPKDFEICRKTFVVQAKPAKSTKVLALECFVLYSNN